MLARVWFSLNRRCRRGTEWPLIWIRPHCARNVTSAIPTNYMQCSANPRMYKCSRTIKAAGTCLCFCKLKWSKWGINPTTRLMELVCLGIKFLTELKPCLKYCDPRVIIQELKQYFHKSNMCWCAYTPVKGLGSVRCFWKKILILKKAAFIGSEIR